MLRANPSVALQRFENDCMTTRILTGITTTGTPHLGNYAGAIRPAILASRDAAAGRSTSSRTTMR